MLRLVQRCALNLIPIVVWFLIMLSSSVACSKDPPKAKDPVRVREDAEAALKADGVILQGPVAPATAYGSAEALVHELVTQLATKNMRGIVTLLWHEEGLSCTEAESEALRQSRSLCAQGMGAATVTGVPGDAKPKRLSTTKVAAGARYEGCMVKGALTVERWELRWSSGLKVAVVIHPEAGAWRVVRLED
jgi:hypothetical protein